MDVLEINPFYHRTKWTLYDKIKVAFLTVLLFPLRALLIILLKAVASILCLIIMAGTSKGPNIVKPITGWRRRSRYILAYVMRLWCKLAGFHNVKVKGRKASFKEAPILVVSPHSTPFDAIAFTYLGAPSLVAKADFQDIPIWNTIVSLSEPVYVFRDDPNSRENTIKEIRRRATSGEEYNQIMIFPEGTCTNRSCLISFKLGAFLPGVPVQPVCIKFPNRIDTVTWAWDGPGLLKMLWLTFSQFYSNFEMELLPVYTPNEEEKRNPRLFADNVRDTMARALGVPTSNLTFNDCRLITQGKEDKLPFQHGFTSFQKLRSEVNLEKSPREELQHYLEILTKKQKRLKLTDFMSRLGVSNPTPEIKKLFSLFDRNDDEAIGSIDFREYLVGLHFMATSGDSRGRLQLIFKLYDQSQRGFLYQSEFLEGVVHGFNVPPAVALRVYQAAWKIGGKSRDGITLEMVLDLAKEDEELADYLECYHSQLIVHKKTAGDETEFTEMRRRISKKPESHGGGQIPNSSREEGEHRQNKNPQVHQESKYSINQEARLLISKETEHIIHPETNQLMNEEAEHAMIQKIEQLTNQETEHLLNQETEHLLNQETEHLLKQETEHLLNQETEHLINQETSHLINQYQEHDSIPVVECLSNLDGYNQPVQSLTGHQQKDHFSNGYLSKDPKEESTKEFSGLFSQICSDKKAHYGHAINQDENPEQQTKEMKKKKDKHMNQHLFKNNKNKTRNLEVAVQNHGHMRNGHEVVEENQEFILQNDGHMSNGHTAEENQQFTLQNHGHISNGHATKQESQKAIVQSQNHLSNGHATKQGNHEVEIQNYGHMSNGYASTEQQVHNGRHLSNGHFPIFQNGKIPHQSSGHLSNRNITSQNDEQITNHCDEDFFKEHHPPLVNEEQAVHQSTLSDEEHVSETSGQFYGQNGSIEKTQTQCAQLSKSFSIQERSNPRKLPKQSKFISERASTEIFFSLDSLSSQISEPKIHLTTLSNHGQTTKQKGISLNKEQFSQERQFHSQIESTDDMKKLS